LRGSQGRYAWGFQFNPDGSRCAALSGPISQSGQKADLRVWETRLGQNLLTAEIPGSGGGQGDFYTPPFHRSPLTFTSEVIQVFRQFGGPGGRSELVTCDGSPVQK